MPDLSSMLYLNLFVLNNHPFCGTFEIDYIIKMSLMIKYCMLRKTFTVRFA